MTLPNSTIDRERQKFVEDASGNVTIRTIGSAGTEILGKVYLTDGTEDAAINPNKRLEVDLEESSLDLMLGTDFSSVFGTASLLTATPAIKVEEQGTVIVDCNSSNVTVDNAAGSGVYVRPGTNVTFDVSDRAARLVGVVYGSQAVQLQQKVTTNDLIVTLDGESVAVTGTFYQGTQPVSLASAQVASGAFASGSISDGADVTQGAKADARNTATDATEITIMQVLKEISYMEQNPASRAVTGTFWQETQPVSGTVDVLGDVAHDAVDSGDPVKIGGRAQEPTSAPDEVADNDRVDTLLDRVGRLATYQGYPRWYAVINASGSGDNTIKASAGAGKKIVVTSVVIVSDGTVDIRWESGSGGTALSGQIPLQTREGYSAYDREGLFETAANALLNLELSDAINVHGHIAGVIIDD